MHFTDEESARALGFFQSHMAEVAHRWDLNPRRLASVIVPIGAAVSPAESGAAIPGGKQ